jgi:hypothetical protein
MVVLEFSGGRFEGRVLEAEGVLDCELKATTSILSILSGKLMYTMRSRHYVAVRLMSTLKQKGDAFHGDAAGCVRLYCALRLHGWDQQSDPD